MEDNVIIKELFIKKICKLKGWDPNNLTTNQSLIINNKFKNLIK